MMGYKNINPISNPPGNTVAWRVSAVYPHAPVTDWELQPAATAQHQESIVLGIAGWGKIEIQYLKFSF